MRISDLSADVCSSDLVKTMLDAYPDHIKSLEKEIAKTQPLVDEIAKVEVAESQFFIEKEFFGFQPKIKARIVNGSSLPISQMKWDAKLFLDEEPAPVAIKILNDVYRPNGGNGRAPCREKGWQYG